jgi:PPM family protein phosphatase
MDTTAHGVSHVGRRENNEDAYCVEPSLGFYAVADGMGGYEGGEIASRLVIDALVASIGDEAPVKDRRAAVSRLDGAIRTAQTLVAREATGNLADMGATLAAMWLRGRTAVIAHVGDSRVYRYRDGKLQQITRDHSLYQDLLAQGRHDVLHQLRGQIEHMVTRCIAADVDVDPEIQVHDTHAGDVYVLCSDGLSDVLSDREIEQTLSRNAPDAASAALVQRAYRAGGTDNITVVVVGVPGAQAQTLAS